MKYIQGSSKQLPRLAVHHRNSSPWDADGKPFKEWKRSAAVWPAGKGGGCVGGETPHSTLANQLGKSGSPPTLPLLEQRFVLHCGVGADGGSQDGIPAALLEGAGAGFPSVCSSR